MTLCPSAPLRHLLDLVRVWLLVCLLQIQLLAGALCPGGQCNGLLARERQHHAWHMLGASDLPDMKMMLGVCGPALQKRILSSSLKGQYSITKQTKACMPELS